MDIHPKGIQEKAANVTKISPVTTNCPKDWIPREEAINKEEKETTVVATLTMDAFPVVLRA